jgi:urea carboxylase
LLANPLFQSSQVPTRIVHLPMAFNDKWNKDAIERYMKSSRDDAPYLPSNVDFVVKNNGLRDQEHLRKQVFDSSYLVLGLGDVYLGAPCAVPVDPRHR